MLDSSYDPIHIIKLYFKALFSIVDWKHVLNENSPNNAYDEFLRILLGIYNEVFPKQKKRKSFDSPWMTKGLVKLSKKKQTLHE